MSNNTPTNSVLLTAKEVAEILAVEQSTLAQWRYRRVGPPWIRYGHRFVRYRREEVDAWLAANTRMPSDEAGGAE